jgi:antitoxin component YwqK of YwqJK toxin-antitoxin module
MVDSFEMRSSGRLRRLVPMVLLTGLLAAGCGSDDSAQKEKTGAEQATEKAEETGPTVDDTRKRNGTLSREGKKIKTYDLNKDQQADQWEIKTQKGQLLRTERDMNFDGQVDVWQYPNKEGETAEEEMDLDMDGTVDLVAYYKDGKIRRKEMSVDFKEQFSIVKFYNKSGKLLRVERDKNSDGKTDVWEYYDDSGNRERVGWDDNGDGVPDSFDKLP